jgi:hypothetical protein
MWVSCFLGSFMPIALIHGCDNKAHALFVNSGQDPYGRIAGRVNQMAQTSFNDFAK